MKKELFTLFFLLTLLSACGPEKPKEDSGANELFQGGTINKIETEAPVVLNGIEKSLKNLGLTFLEEHSDVGKIFNFDTHSFDSFLSKGTLDYTSIEKNFALYVKQATEYLDFFKKNPDKITPAIQESMMIVSAKKSVIIQIKPFLDRFYKSNLKGKLTELETKLNAVKDKISFFVWEERLKTSLTKEVLETNMANDTSDLKNIVKEEFPSIQGIYDLSHDLITSIEKEAKSDDFILLTLLKNIHDTIKNAAILEDTTDGKIKISCSTYPIMYDAGYSFLAEGDASALQVKLTEINITASKSWEETLTENFDAANVTTTFSKDTFGEKKNFKLLIHHTVLNDEKSEMADLSFDGIQPIFSKMACKLEGDTAIKKAKLIN